MDEYKAAARTYPVTKVKITADAAIVGALPQGGGAVIRLIARLLATRVKTAR